MIFRSPLRKKKEKKVQALGGPLEDTFRDLLQSQSIIPVCVVYGVALLDDKPLRHLAVFSPRELRAFV